MFRVILLSMVFLSKDIMLARAAYGSLLMG